MPPEAGQLPLDEASQLPLDEIDDYAEVFYPSQSSANVIAIDGRRWRSLKRESLQSVSTQCRELGSVFRTLHSLAITSYEPAAMFLTPPANFISTESTIEWRSLIRQSTTVAVHRCDSHEGLPDTADFKVVQLLIDTRGTCFGRSIL